MARQMLTRIPVEIVLLDQGQLGVRRLAEYPAHVGEEQTTRRGIA